MIVWSINGHTSWFNMNDYNLGLNNTLRNSLNDLSTEGLKSSSNYLNRIYSYLVTSPSIENFPSFDISIENDSKMNDMLMDHIFTNLQDSQNFEFENFENKSLDINHTIQNSTVFISKDNPFYSTDLIVFKNDYKGVLPLNGILEKDFEKVSKIYNNIKNNHSFFKFNEEEKSQGSVLDYTLKLLTRPIGRELILQLIESDESIFIELGEGFTAVKQFNVPSPKYIITLPRDPSLVDVSKVYGRHGIEKKTLPPFLSFAHELIHILHYQKGENATESTDLFHPLFTDQEEQATITGYKQVPQMRNFDVFTPFVDPLSQSEDEMIAEFVEFEKSQSSIFSNWNKLNENAFASQFSQAIRWGHGGGHQFTKKDYFSESFFNIARLLYSHNLNEINEVYNSPEDKQFLDNFKKEIIIIAIDTGNQKIINQMLSRYTFTIEDFSDILEMEQYSVLSTILKKYSLSQQENNELRDYVKKHIDEINNLTQLENRDEILPNAEEIFQLYQMLIPKQATAFSLFKKYQTHMKQLIQSENYDKFLNDLIYVPSISMLMTSDMQNLLLQNIKDHPEKCDQAVLKIIAEKLVETKIAALTETGNQIFDFINFPFAGLKRMRESYNEFKLLTKRQKLTESISDINNIKDENFDYLANFFLNFIY